MHKKHINMLECPVCHGDLRWDIEEENGDRIINAQIICSKCKADYEVRDEIAVFLTPDLPRNDLWEKGESGLEKFFKENQEIYKELMTTPEAELNGADYWYKASYLEIKGNYEGSSRMFKNAMEKIYTQEYLNGWKSQREFISENDKIHMDVLDKYSSIDYATKERAEDTFNRDNWNSEIQNSFMAQIKPTPKGKILEGAEIDGFPVEDTEIEFCVIVASK